MNMYKKTETILSSLGNDEKRVLEAIARADTIGKEDIALSLGWGSTKLNNCLASLKHKDLLAVSTLTKDGTGRKPMSFSVKPELGYFVGIHCDIASDSFVLLDAAGHVLKETEIPALAWDAPNGHIFLSTLNSFVGPEFRSNLLGVGISSAIQFNHASENTHQRSPSFSNDSAQLLAKIIEDNFQIPVLVGRPQVLMCYQGDLRNLVYQKESFINIIITDHLGIAVIVNGERWLGQSGLSGDLGHLKVTGNNRPCYCGAKGCLRTMLTYAGICQEARERLADPEYNGNSGLDPVEFDGPAYQDGVRRLIDAANNQHNTLATSILHDSATEFGIALATVVSLFNPARLFVHSILTEARDLFSEQVRLMIRKNCLELYSRNLDLEFRSYSPSSNAVGAAAFSRDTYFSKQLRIASR